VQEFFWGASATAAWTIGLFFLGYWRDTRDRLFGFFAAAFWLMAATWLVLAIARPSDETRPYVFLLRLAAFLLIAIAIVDKNRATHR
jgi:hypothetical protein